MNDNKNQNPPDRQQRSDQVGKDTDNDGRVVQPVYGAAAVGRFVGGGRGDGEVRRHP